MTAHTFDIAATGGDYSSLSTWEAAEQSTIADGDFFVCYIFESYANTTNLAIAGWTFTGDAHLVFTKDPLATHHQGIPGVGATINHRVIMQNSSGYLLCTDLYFLSVNQCLGASHWGNSDDVRAHRCIFKSTASYAFPYSHAGGAGGHDYQLWNCLFWDSYSWGASIDNGTGVLGTVDCRNLTLIGGNTQGSIYTGGFRISGSQLGFTGTANNITIFDNPEGSNTDEFTVDEADIIPYAIGAEDGSETGTNSFVSRSAEFTDHDNNDWTVADTDSRMYNIGFDNSAVFTDDIRGITRTQWDSGAFGFVAASGNTAALSLTNLSMSASGVEEIVSSAAAALSMAIVAASATQGIPSTATATLAAALMVASGASLDGISGTAVVTLGAPALVASGDETMTATAALALSFIVLDGLGIAGITTSTGVINLPALSVIAGRLEKLGIKSPAVIRALTSNLVSNLISKLNG